MGKLRISAEGRVTIPGDTFLLKEVYANSIKAPQNSTLRIVASNEIQIKALSDGVEDSQEHGQQRHTNDSHLLTIGPNTVESYSNQLVIRDVQGNLLMLVNDDHVAVTANKLRVNNPLGIQFNCSLQAPSVELLEFSSSSSRTSSNAELKVQSLTRKTRILGPKSVSLDSKSGSVRFTSLRRLSLMSKRHQIALKASWVEFRGLRTALPTKRGRTYPGIRQLCLCPENGILFVAPAAGHCIFDKSICESPMDGH
ncbi:Delta-sarcoglycan [Halotydeus destructor]|nr:Delta-sarcoglycan [Halotydeus destructor]